MIDPIAFPTEEFAAEDIDVSGSEVIIRIGSFNYIFELVPQVGLAYISRSAVLLGDDDDDYNPFDPSEYR